MQKITKYLCGIIQQASKITEKSFKVYNKDNYGDLVTDCDNEVENFLINKLTHKYPEYKIISEEFNPNQELTDNCFVIDPIDGTINFASGIPLWGMQMAVVENGEVVCSVIYLPKLNELYYADCDGAFLNGEQLRTVSDNQDKKQIFTISGNNLPVITLHERDLVNYRNFRAINSAAVSYAWVAAGRLKGYYLRADSKWDYLPGMYLVKMAGGLIKDCQGNHIAVANQTMFDYFDKILIPETTKKIENKKAVKPINSKTASKTK